jgi:alkanesulfonate monooxygenase SsuD/methylene tetrahydromethanopterin reductase-like flavin-dependent oxidoreductase (luciferase family)
VLVGGGRKPAARKIAEYADGWLPIYPGDPGALLDEVRAIREQLGRDVPVTVMNAPADEDVLARLADAGIERALLELPRTDRDATLRTLDGHAALVS